MGVEEDARGGGQGRCRRKDWVEKDTYMCVGNGVDDGDDGVINGYGDGRTRE